MHYNIIKKSVFFLAIFLLIQPFSPSASINDYNIDPKLRNEIIKKIDFEGYGFIIALPSSLEISNTPELQYETLNMINDCLRNNISIYWIANDIELYIKNLFSDELPKDRDFSRGSYVIPFTGQQSIDIMSIVIISEYCYINSSQTEKILAKNIFMT